MLYNRKFKTNLRNGYKVWLGKPSTLSTGKCAGILATPAAPPFRWMTF